MPPRKSISSIPPLPKEGFVRLPQVLAVIPVSKTQFWEGIKTGKYPSPIQTWPPNNRMARGRYSWTH